MQESSKGYLGSEKIGKKERKERNLREEKNEKKRESCEKKSAYLGKSAMVLMRFREILLLKLKLTNIFLVFLSLY